MMDFGECSWKFRNNPHVINDMYKTIHKNSANFPKLHRSSMSFMNQPDSILNFVEFQELLIRFSPNIIC